jgi:manganese/iron transport system ATP-binding protein
MLEVHQLSVNYRGLLAIKDISVALETGELVGLIGPNGAGKSTLIKALLGLVPIQSGRILFQGKPLHRHKQVVAYVPQRSQVDWDYPITAWNVVMMAHTASTGWFRGLSPHAKRITAAALDRVGLSDLRHRQIGELSGGQQQRVFLARALAQQAELFLLDEPFTGIDKKTEAVILEIFAELRASGKTLLVCSHEWGKALHRYDRLLLLNQELLANGTPELVMTLENIQRAYGENLRLDTNHQVSPLFFC